MLVIHSGALAHDEASWAPIASLFPAGARAAFAHPHDEVPSLFPEEQAAIVQAVPRRQREFALGRWCARAALAQLGVDAVALRVGSDGAPVWPTGIIGSISHCECLVGAVVAPADQIVALGFDAETAAPLGNDLVRMICSPEELRRTRGLPSPESGWPKMIFSVKEAIYKCVAPLTGIIFGFHDVSVSFSATGDRFSAHLMRGDIERFPDFSGIEGRVIVSSNVIHAVAFIPADGRAPKAGSPGGLS